VNELLIYHTDDNEVNVRLDGDTVWLSQEQMATLFERDRSVINRHLRNIFKEGELEQVATCAFFANVQTEGERTITRQIEHYNNTLTALALLVAESNADNKDLMIRLIINLLASRDSNS
jgi:hypothetical protein